MLDFGKLVPGAVLVLVSFAIVAHGQRPKTPIITAQTINSTSAEIQVQLVENVSGKTTYTNCQGQVVQLKLKSETVEHFKTSVIIERPGGFKIEGLVPNTTYEIRVACKTDGTPASVGDWTAPLAFNTPPIGGAKKDDKPKKGDGSITTLNILLFGILFVISLAAPSIYHIV